MFLISIYLIDELLEIFSNQDLLSKFRQSAILPKIRKEFLIWKVAYTPSDRIEYTQSKEHPYHHIRSLVLWNWTYRQWLFLQRRLFKPRCNALSGCWTLEVTQNVRPLFELATTCVNIARVFIKLSNRDLWIYCLRNMNIFHVVNSWEGPMDWVFTQSHMSRLLLVSKNAISESLFRALVQWLKAQRELIQEFSYPRTHNFPIILECRIFTCSSQVIAMYIS